MWGIVRREREQGQEEMERTNCRFFGYHLGFSDVISKFTYEITHTGFYPTGGQLSTPGAVAPIRE